jgi:hypothetical protein
LAVDDSGVGTGLFERRSAAVAAVAIVVEGKTKVREWGREGSEERTGLPAGD